ncbi:hypothetical protein Q5752_000619 [Cryptotrichosporon argae]
MLRRVLRRAPRRSGPVCRASSAVATAARPVEPYGNDYGAGPSRLPYIPPAVLPSALPSRRPTTRHAARNLRAQLAELSHGHFAMPRGFARALGRDLGSLSRLETHALIHHLVRTRRGLLAASLISDVIQHGLSRSHRRRRVFSPVTLAALFTCDAISLPPPRPRSAPGAHVGRRTIPYFSVSNIRQPTIDEQRPHALSFQTTLLLTALDDLRRIRHARPQRIYELLIRQCLAEQRPDEAAKVYVGLVEEWIVEGRVAEGADPADFAEGGGPPRAPSRSSSLLSLWFGGVRTWRLPGEALSLHDRLDLWHPRHLALGDKLRGFPLPLPTSPPSLVPQPAVRLLQPILNALRLDPRDEEPAAYASTMRALAILANPVLNRTLPVPAVPALLKAFGGSPIVPEVYPESFTEVPKRNSWAYTANTQVHVALVSLLWSPPNFAHASLLSERISSPDQRRLPPPRGIAAYKLPPLPWRSCLVLLEYGAARLRQPRLVGRLVDYMRETWTTWNAHALNLLHRGGARARDAAVVAELDAALFGSTTLGADQRERDKRVLLGPGDQAGVEPNEESLVNLVTHLAKTGDKQRLLDVVHRLIPFLSFHKALSSADVASVLDTHGLEQGASGRPSPAFLTPRLYAAIVAAVASAGHTGLAQRVFVLATQAEHEWVRLAALAGPGAAAAPRLGIDIFTTMLAVYKLEAERGRKHQSTRAVGWRPPPSAAHLSRARAADIAVVNTYNMARGRWLAALRAGHPLGPAAPDIVFFNTAIAARARAWGLDDAEEQSDIARVEMMRVFEDMRTFAFTVPPGLDSKLRTGRVDGDIYLPLEKRTKSATARRVWSPIKRDLERVRREAVQFNDAAREESGEERASAAA